MCYLCRQARTAAYRKTQRQCTPLRRAPGVEAWTDGSFLRPDYTRRPTRERLAPREFAGRVPRDPDTLELFP